MCALCFIGSRFMNQYFLLIACLQLWSLITPVNPASTWGPLIFIFAVSASKEAWDDYNRYLSDKKANEKEVWIVRQGIRKLIQAQDICLGNIVWLRENDEVPCDLVLLGTADPQGFCYVETAALDGETDLKTRSIPSACMGIDGVIECPSPDKDIRRFDANMRLFPPFLDNDVFPLTIKNTLLQSCYLRNTEWACGVAVYTVEDLYHVCVEMIRGICGNQTKLGMCRGIPEPKLTAVDAMIDKLTGAIFVFQIVVVIVLGIAGNVWKDTEGRKLWYVRYPKEGPWYEFLVIPLRFELLCSIMIPISIKVSLDLVKSLYAKFIDWDDQMVDPETGIRSNATNTAISEDLGQVEYILTDKTGTLTENKMIFKRCCISGRFYGNESGDALTDAQLLNDVSTGSADVIKFLKVMAICNTVIPVRSKSGTISYKALSQDEEALVCAASRLRMIFANKNGNILDINFNASPLRYEVLDTLEFTSDRKRMSVVVRDCQSGEIFLLSKGADETILPLTYSVSKSFDLIFVSLLYWSISFLAYMHNMLDAFDLYPPVSCFSPEKILAVGQQVRTFAEAVEQYAQMGLRTLCLAWRKLEEGEYQEWASMFKEANSTLVDREWRVAEVCQRLEHDLEILGVAAIEDRLQEGVPETIETLRKAGINFWMLTGDKMNTAIQIALSCNFVSPEPKGQLLIIDGKTEDEVCRSLERVLLTTRITESEPKDVAFVVDGWALEIALKHYRKAFTELAILSRTAICCRVTPSQKAQLVELLKLCDYRTLAIGDGGNDVRMIQQADIGVGISGREGLQAARAADYSIGSVSGTSLFNSVSLMAYNVFYTSVPVLVSVLDKDLSERTAIVVFVITIHSYAFEKSEMEEVAMVALSGCIWLQAFVVALETNSFTILQHLAIWGNLLGFYVINWIVSAIPASGMYTIMFRLCKQPSYWITMILIVATGMGPVLALKYLRYTYRSSKINILQQAERLGGPILSLGIIEPQSRSSLDKDLAPLSITQPKNRTSVYEPLLSESPSATRRSIAPAQRFDYFQSQSPLASTHTRKDN
ncbi:hypothetical protein SASPL_118801 [Salvia splendens]|uniref:P-type ATPase C-terminal domain-containing protein n=1 Tax=Salvia splendens TaxID=180675 RepID=A0A8X8Y315_SALSN|nr:hypothetical protein SASPL_118801 [Salvia splendens]